MIGIYYIKCINESKYYIGSSKDIKTRLVNHFSTLRNGRHKNKDLQKDFIKYGENCFNSGVLEECLLEELLSKEKEWVKKFNCYNKRDIMRNNYLNNNGKKLVSNSRKNKKHSEETKEKIRQRQLGKKHTQESKNKVSKANSGENHPLYGKNHKEETKIKMSESAKGRRNNCKLTLDIALKIKKLLLESIEYNETQKFKEERIGSIFGLSSNVIGQIKHGRHFLSKELGGGLKDWK